MKINQCVVLPMYAMQAKMSQQDLLKEIKAIGFAGVEFWGRDDVVPFEETAEAARGLGLRLVSMVGHGHVSEKDGPHAEGFSRARNHDRLEAELKESIDIAAKYGMPGLIVLSGHRNPAESDYESLRVCARGLRRIAPYAEEKGVNLNMEILNTTVDHPRYLCDNVDWAIVLCEMVASPRVKLLFDIYHVQIMAGNVIRGIERAANWIGHFHTAGNPGRRNLDDDQELNYRGICRAIARSGYDLYVGHEFEPRGDVVAALRDAFAICSGESSEQSS